MKLVCMASSVAAPLIGLVDFFSPPANATPIGRWLGFGAPCLGSLNSLTMLWLCFRLEPRRLIDMAPAFQVLQGFFISVYYHASPIALRDASRGWSPLVVWLIVFPLLVPNTRRRVLIATLATAAMDVVGMMIHVVAGAPLPTLAKFGRSFLPVAVSSVLAIVLSRIIHALNQEVKRARELGSYQLVRAIGRGGMGEVWQAQHRLLARPAAIKLIRPDASGGISSDTLARFEREAQATAALCSPHTVQVYDFGITEEGAFYYVMELLSGMDADTLVRRHGPMPPERVVHVLAQVCGSLEEAHERDLVHRDIKPANIFVCRYGLELDFVKVLDFGLVKSLGVAAEAGATAVGVVAGTPEYMAPEVARGERTFDRRADLYSLGCVAYRLLSGKPVFDSQSPIDYLIDHVRSVPIRPSGRTGLAIPAALEDLVMECLEKDPARRPQTAGELARRLRALELPPWTHERAREWWAAAAAASPDPSEEPTRSLRNSTGRTVARAG
ncbi:MAG TPA: serine/threonine-protein kinase [Thermoanaerobaculia bacterium]|nr:serine/threonine-protein kinase [Thermoanaerobaculia bacterium]